jgi:hypothetical protein
MTNSQQKQQTKFNLISSFVDWSSSLLSFTHNKAPQLTSISPFEKEIEQLEIVTKSKSDFPNVVKKFLEKLNHPSCVDLQHFLQRFVRTLIQIGFHQLIVFKAYFFDCFSFIHAFNELEDPTHLFEELSEQHENNSSSWIQQSLCTSNLNMKVCFFFNRRL